MPTSAYMKSVKERKARDSEAKRDPLMVMLRGERITQNVRTSELATYLGVSEQQVNNIMRNHADKLPLGRLVALAKYFEICEETFLGCIDYKHYGRTF